MPWNRYAVGYHGCDARLVEELCTQRAQLEPGNRDYDWLGRGFYFWEDSPARALNWAKAISQNNPKRISKPAVVGAVIDLGLCLNLTEAENLELISLAHEELLENFKSHNLSLPKNSGLNFGSRKLDFAVFETLHQIRQENQLQAFDTVRGFFVEGEPIYPSAGIRQLDHIQICVRNPKNIIGYFLPLDRLQVRPEKK